MSDSVRIDVIPTPLGDRSLLDALIETPLHGAELARIEGLANEFEAELVRDALEREGIHCLVQSNRDTAFDGLFLPQRAWGYLVVRLDQADKAVEVLRQLRETYDQPQQDASDDEGDVADED